MEFIVTKHTSVLAEASCFFGPMSASFLTYLEAELQHDWMPLCNDLALDWFHDSELARTSDKVETFKVIGSFNGGSILFALDEIWRVKSGSQKVEQRLAVKVQRKALGMNALKALKAIEACFKLAWGRMVHSRASDEDFDPRAWLLNDASAQSGPQCAV